FFDNLSGFGRNTSDLLSKIITESSFTQRELYSNDVDVMRTIKGVIGLNGINLAASQADLLERSIVVEMEQIDPDNRRSEKSLKAEFDQVKGKILGGILTLLSSTLKKYPEIDHDTNIPRMADYALYGEAMSQALGNKPDYFKTVYWKNINETTEKGLQSNIVASAILEFLSKTPEWSGTATALYEILSDVAVMNKIIPGRTYKWWPQEPNKLSEQINLVKPMLRLKNIEVTGQRTSTERTVRLINKDFSIKAENMNQIIPSTSTQLSIVRSKSSLEVNGYDASEAGEAPPEDAELDSEDILDQIDF
ncbi:MAG TPA: hypothetical protein PLV72_04130, partial [Candidatus Magasanikbacteria bacterium]|nr:hypothetical protein [Candidatus Magasanikbacteria bacterium]